MSKKWLISGASVFMILLIALGWHYISTKKESKPVPVAKQETPKPQPTAQPSKQAPSGFTPKTFTQLHTMDQETIRDLIQQVRKLGDPQATPEACSLLTIGDTHYALTSFWDPNYYRDPSIWKATEQNNLWSPELKKDLSKPGAWMVALLTKDPKSPFPDVALRWAAPPDTMTPPAVSQTEPVAQACNAGWNEILKQKYAFFSFVKATADQTTLQLHFTVVKTDKPQNVRVTVPINGSLNNWSLGAITLQDE
ncbi:hypothetical protein Desaci_1458 [Desulfosporosinus acidiphilus SJ4]|uniref:Uncharacterized protein n=1 Tax=Desulfosporosinus acidiphilus (strain DSM 22704 / JCM 16185 / SJ4) TaxID=646529 RepID=I4D3V0_DESAJ|nr:hypothetical protein [Desulfosporosinus acidiphilus]AFM40474.1 hypothetical protein Desaci_1458 [Desulfosporosinus acidiphilus SJ4]